MVVVVVVLVVVLVLLLLLLFCYFQLTNRQLAPGLLSGIDVMLSFSPEKISKTINQLRSLAAVLGCRALLTF